ncbi:LPS translocon maturation chaperone LptM [Shewanella sp. OMA3-2]|uniref:LPS translocon maturation chaperone LptM n=1 Tax=Shewanella sp. OMA3-2 TaxID=2908650 RepID=UPI001F1C0D52|nr:lipoprotein [Shewanella sp. OMA3-2]UJF22617.1 lipoprotein [Shewanella sp. OMA3-2]
MRLLLLLLLASLVLSACGQKGPLYKTPAPEDNKTSAAPVTTDIKASPAEAPTEAESIADKQQ